MLKNKMFLIAALAWVASPAYSAGGLNLYSGKASYLYAYPTGKAALTEKDQGGRKLLAYQLPAGVAAGGGAGIAPVDLSPYRSRGALQFFITGSLGGGAIQAGFTMAKREGQASLQVGLPVSAYASLKKGWNKVTIPLADFPAQGLRWNPDTQSNDQGSFNWKDVGEFTVGVVENARTPMTFYITGVQVLAAVDTAALNAARQAASTVSGPLAVYGPSGPASGVGYYSYPEGKSSAKEAGGKLVVQFDTGSWSGGGITLAAPTNLSALKARGKLVLQVAGGSGGETFHLGLRCKANQSAAQVDINPYLPGGLKRGAMSTLSVPLADLGDKGVKWDAAENKNVELPFDWSSVNEIVFDNKGDKANGKIFIGSAQIIP